MQRFACAACHFARNGTAAAERDGRCDEQTLFKLNRLLFAALIRHDADCELFKQAACRQQHRRAQDIKERVRNRDAGHGGVFIQNSRCEHDLYNPEGRQ